LVLRVPILDRHVLALDIAGFLQTLEEGNNDVLVFNFGGLETEEADASDAVTLLRPRHHRPRRRAPKPRDEIPPSHLRLQRFVSKTIPSGMHWNWY
jgi:hypothetical protein